MKKLIYTFLISLMLVGSAFGFEIERAETDHVFCDTVSKDSPIDGDVVRFVRPFAITLSSISCIVDPADSGESVVLDFSECDSNGDNCASSLSSTITCANTNTAGTISDASIDASDYLKFTYGTVTGTVTNISATVCYTVTP